MPDQIPHEIYRARFHAEIERIKSQLNLFAAGTRRVFEQKSGTPDMVDITALHIDDLHAHIEELELFLSKVKSN